MTKEDLLKRLNEINENYRYDPEICHQKCDSALLDFIDDEEISKAYDEVEKWYA